MAIAGPLADRFGRRLVLFFTALLFTVSALGCAVAESFSTLVTMRIIGGFGVGGALLIAPIYIAEIAPPERRGQMVSFNQLNIVLGFSAAFFSNYFLDQAEFSWRFMMGVEAIPAAIYGLLLFSVPRSPRWLALRGRSHEARAVLERINGEAAAAAALTEMQESLLADAARGKPAIGEMFQPCMPTTTSRRGVSLTRSTCSRWNDIYLQSVVVPPVEEQRRIVATALVSMSPRPRYLLSLNSRSATSEMWNLRQRSSLAD